MSAHPDICFYIERVRKYLAERTHSPEKYACSDHQQHRQKPTKQRCSCVTVPVESDEYTQTIQRCLGTNDDADPHHYPEHDIVRDLRCGLTDDTIGNERHVCIGEHTQRRLHTTDRPC